LNIDWEFAGYFPSCFELPLWRAVDWAEEQEIYKKANIVASIRFKQHFKL
jgi:hypothetical protein